MRRLQDASLPQPPSLKIRKYLLDAGFWNHDKARQDRAPPGYTTRPREANPPPAGPEHEDLLRTSQEAPQTCSRCKSQCPGPAGERLSPARPGPRPAQKARRPKRLRHQGQDAPPVSSPRPAPGQPQHPPQDRASPDCGTRDNGANSPGHTARSESQDRPRQTPALSPTGAASSRNTSKNKMRPAILKLTPFRLVEAIIGGKIAGNAAYPANVSTAALGTALIENTAESAGAAFVNRKVYPAITHVA